MIGHWNAARRTHTALAICLALAVLLPIEMEGAVTEAHEIEARNKQAIQAGFDGWRSGTGSVFDLLAPDATWTIVGNSPVSRTFMSKQEFMDVVITPFNARLSSRLVPAVRGIFADGDMVIVLFDGAGTARDGEPYTNTYAWFMQMRDRRVIKVTAFFDTIEFTDFWRRIEPAR